MLLGFLVLALLAAGCGERAEPLGDLPAAYPVTVRGAGDEPTQVARLPKRVVALSPGATELMVSMGVGERLVGAPLDVPGTPARVAPVVTRGGQIDVAEVGRLRPDLIVATTSTDPVDAARAARETGAALYVQPSDSIADVKRGTIELGFLVGEPARARQLATRVERRIATVQARVADAPIVTVFVDTGLFVTISERSLLGELVRRAGGRSVAGKTPGLEPFDLERLTQLDPDVYLATSDSMVTLRRLRTNRETRRLRAVRRGRFVILPADLVTSAGPRLPAGLAAVARALHPDAFR